MDNIIEEDILRDVAPQINSSDPYLRVYPNPASNVFKLESGQLTEQSMRVEIRDAYGRKIWEHNAMRSNAILTIDCSTWSSGVYFVYVNLKGTNSRGQQATVSVDDLTAYANEHIKGLNIGKQTQHIPGSHNFIEGKSILLSDPEIMLKEVYTLKYQFVRYNNAGQAILKFNHPVGFYIQNGINKGITNLATIHARSNGLIHFVPAWPLP